MSDVHERLRRLLFLVPYVSRHPGITLDALAKALGLAKDELIRDLDLLTFVGRPPFQPDDFIDLHVENDRVYVDLDQRFNKPPRLTPAEAAALVAAAELMRPAAKDALGTALAKLETVLPAGSRERFRDIARTVDARPEGMSEVAPLTEAIRARRVVKFDYASQTSGASSKEPRRVQPHDIFNHRGLWYLSGFSLERNEERLYRLDRISHLEVQADTFVANETPHGHVPNPTERGDVRVRFSPTAAPYLRERFGAEARAVEGGGVEVLVSGDSERWLTRWVLSFGGEAEVLEPQWARAAVARVAKESLS